MEREYLDRTLAELCERRAPVTVISVESGCICRGRFRDLSPELVTLDLPQRSQKGGFQLLSQCVCLFRYGNGGCVFLAAVHSYRTDCSPEVLIIQRPADAASESRRSFRVPVTKQLPQVEMTGEDGSVLQVDAVDLSVTGALVEFSDEEVPDLPVGTRFTVELRLDELVVTLAAEVRRRYGKRYGLFFSDVLADEQLNPPTELSALVARLEQIWLGSGI
ncbi:MAG: PilZ domain-containing protein [bacterium]